MSNQLEMKDDSIKKVLLKMGIKSENGHIYFNELLYRLMREKYYSGQFRLNTRMTVIELTTQFKLYQVTQKAKGRKTTADDEGGDIFVTSMKAQETSVNPFMTQIFHRISFNTWHNYMLKCEKRKRIREQRVAAGLPADDGKAEQLDETLVEKVVVTREPELVEYTSEEDDGQSFSKIHKSKQADGSNSDESAFGDPDNTLKMLEKTPAIHRLKTKLMK
jgi:hypothetical protein